MPNRRSVSALTMSALLVGSATLHATHADFFDTMVPPQLPGSARFWTLASGVAELGVAGLVAVPRTRRLGGAAAAALFVAVFPANVQMAVDAADSPPREKALAWARLPFQVPMVLWALRVRRDA